MHSITTPVHLVDVVGEPFSIERLMSSSGLIKAFCQMIDKFIKKTLQSYFKVYILSDT